MKKFYFVLMPLIVFLIFGCGAEDRSPSSPVTNSYEIKQVATLTSPALELYKSYNIYTGSTLTDIGNARYFVANTGSASSQATLNLGFSDALSIDQTLVVVNSSTNEVVFAYNPAGGFDNNGNDIWKTGGSVKYSGGRLLRYRSLTIEAAPTSNDNTVQNSSVVAIDSILSSDNIIEITLNGSDAEINGEKVTEYEYVWHADPEHESEYFTEGINGETEIDDYKTESAFNNDDVYIAHDIRYMNSDLTFIEGQTAVKDEDTEYVVYYSDEVANSVAAELSSDFKGPYIFATLPMENGSTLAQTKSKMTHDSATAYTNSVLHISKSGIYSLSGTWNGQISIDSDSVIILDGVTVKCTVAPAILFNDNLTEYGDNSESSVASTYKTLGEDLIGTLIDNESSLVIIGDNSENNITGANVYRILKPTPKSSATKVDGKDISDQKKLYKRDGAFYSHVSLGISGEGDGNGILNVTSSTFEGFGSELHMTVDGGTINVTAPDDGINVNEDNVSVFTMLSGNLTISSTKGDGIDSNGYVVINGGTLNITAGTSSQSSAGEAGIDAEKDIYIDSSATYNWTSATGSNNAPFSGNNENENNTPPTPPSESQNQSNSTNTNTNSNTTTTTTTTNTDSTNYYTDNTGNTSGTTGTTTNNNTYIPNIVASNDYTVDNNNNVNDNYNYQDNYDIAALINAQTSTSRGTTKIQMATGVDFSMLSEDQQYYLPRTVPTSGNVFTLERKVNEFSAIVIGR